MSACFNMLIYLPGFASISTSLYKTQKLRVIWVIWPLCEGSSDPMIALTVHNSRWCWWHSAAGLIEALGRNISYVQKMIYGVLGERRRAWALWTRVLHRDNGNSGSFTSDLTSMKALIISQALCTINLQALLLIKHQVTDQVGQVSIEAIISDTMSLRHIPEAWSGSIRKMPFNFPEYVELAK